MGFCSESSMDILGSSGVGVDSTIVATVVSVTDLNGNKVDAQIGTNIQDYFNNMVFNQRKEKWVIDFRKNSRLEVLRTKSV